MKRIIWVSIMCALCLLPLVASAQYTYQGTSSITIVQPHYADVDGAGRLWLCEYGNPSITPTVPAIRCLDSNMNNVSFSPIPIAVQFAGSAPSGIAVASDGKVYIGNDATLNQVNNIVIYKPDGSLDGTGYFTATYPTDHNIRPGDVDFDNSDHLFLGHKVENGFSVFDRTTGALLAGCPVKGPTWGTGETGTWHLNRGMAVTGDGTKVYLADSDGGGLDYFEGSITGSTASYTLVTDGMDSANIGNPTVVAIDGAGRLWVPGGTAREIRVYDTYDNSFLASYTFSQPQPSGDDMRIIGLANDSQTLYLADDFGLNPPNQHVYKYTGTPPLAHTTPTPPPTPSPTEEGFAAAHCWTIYE